MSRFDSLQAAALRLAALLALVVLSGCEKGQHDSVFLPFYNNRTPVIDALAAHPDTIGPSDSTVVVCTAHDVDGDRLVYDWVTDARLNIQGTPVWNKYLNNTRSNSHVFYNANLRNPINDSAWVYCGVRDSLGGGASRHVFITLRPPGQGSSPTADKFGWSAARPLRSSP